MAFCGNVEAIAMTKLNLFKNSFSIAYTDDVVFVREENINWKPTDVSVENKKVNVAC